MEVQIDTIIFENDEECLKSDEYEGYIYDVTIDEDEEDIVMKVMEVIEEESGEMVSHLTFYKVS